MFEFEMYIGVPLILSQFILHIKIDGWDFAKHLKITLSAKLFVEEMKSYSMLKILKRPISNNRSFPEPWPGGSVGGVLSFTPKGCGLAPWSGRVQEPTDQSLSLPLPLSQINSKMSSGEG